MFNLIMIYLNVSMPHLVPWKIQRSCISTPGLWYFASSSVEINSNVKKYTSVFNEGVVKLDSKEVSHSTLD